MMAQHEQGCVRRQMPDGSWKCDRCERVWSNILLELGWRPLACPEHETMQHPAPAAAREP